jgi:hypothetical protein
MHNLSEQDFVGLISFADTVEQLFVPGKLGE